MVLPAQLGRNVGTSPKNKGVICRVVFVVAFVHHATALLSGARMLLQAYMEEAQRHDFCVSARLSTSLAYKSADILKDVLSQKT